MLNGLSKSNTLLNLEGYQNNKYLKTLEGVVKVDINQKLTIWFHNIRFKTIYCFSNFE